MIAKFTRQLGLCVALGWIGQAQAQEPAPDWETVVAAANQEGRVTLYSNAVPEQVERLITRFNEDYPNIAVAHSRGTGELAVRVANEVAARNDGADVFIFSDPIWFTLNESSVVELNSPAADAFPAEGWFIEGKVPFIGYAPFGILAWNTDYLPDGLKTFQDLLKPELAGHIGAREQMTAVLAAYLDFLETELGPEYLPALGQQKPKFYTSGVPMMQSLAAGEIWATGVGIVGSIRDLQEQGAPIDWAIPEPRGFANTWGAGVISVSRRPNAARVFMDFLISPAGQEALNGEESSASPLPNIPGTLDIERLQVMDPSKYDQPAREAWTQKFDQYFRR